MKLSEITDKIRHLLENKKHIKLNSFYVTITDKDIYINIVIFDAMNYKIMYEKTYKKILFYKNALIEINKIFANYENR